MESLEDRVRRVSAETIEIVAYDSGWPALYESEKRHLLSCFPEGCILRVEHVGSTAVVGLAAKPIVDILVGVADVEVVREQVVPLMEGQGYDYFWRPFKGDESPPFYPWFIKRNAGGCRTHHIHVVEMGWQEVWDWMLFRDYLREHPEAAAAYAELKRGLAEQFQGDRARYTEEKTVFIIEVTERARRTQGG